MPTYPYPSRIISGGQTGADRGGLDAARDLALALGGCCPLGRRAEDGMIPECYPLTELGTTHYIPRTERNAKDSDATIIFNGGRTLSAGSKATVKILTEIGRPVLVLRLPLSTFRSRADEVTERIALWLAAWKPATLNVAGNRESVTPGMQALVRGLLSAAIRLAPERSATQGAAIQSITEDTLAPAQITFGFGEDSTPAKTQSRSHKV